MLIMAFSNAFAQASFGDSRTRVPRDCSTDIVSSVATRGRTMRATKVIVRCARSQSPNTKRLAPVARPVVRVGTPSQKINVPTSRELERMRRKRQQQQFKLQIRLRKQQQEIQRLREELPLDAEELLTEEPRECPREQGDDTVKEKKHSAKPMSKLARIARAVEIKSRRQPSPRRRHMSPPPPCRKVRRARPLMPVSSPVSADDVDEEMFKELIKEYDLTVNERPKLVYLLALGFQPADLKKLASQRREIFFQSDKTLRRKIEFLTNIVGLTGADIVKVITRFPRILEHGEERSLLPRLDFLKDECGVLASDIPKLVKKAPMVLTLKIDDTLRPRAEFLRKELRLPPGSVGKLISRHPQVLTCAEEGMARRISFLHEQGLSKDDAGRSVLAHPQILHYSIDSMKERLEYFGSVGLTARDIAATIKRFPQIFSLSVESNLAPKWRYLVEHLGGGVATLCSYPGYFSLSLNGRIIPRHRFLLARRDAANLPSPMPFPLMHFKPTDTEFAQNVCNATLEEYEEFKETLLFETELGTSSAVHQHHGMIVSTRTMSASFRSEVV